MIAAALSFILAGLFLMVATILGLRQQHRLLVEEITRLKRDLIAAKLTADSFERIATLRKSKTD